MAETNELAKFTLPIKSKDENYGYPHLQYLLELGAIIEEHHYDRFNKHFIAVTLPEGFSLVADADVNGFKQTTIFDENLNNRGTLLIKKTDISVANIYLNTKYKIMQGLRQSGDLKFISVYFGNNNEEVFASGIVTTSVRDNSTLYINSRLASLRDECRIKANELYPDWENPLKYWDDSLEKEDTQVLSRTNNK